MPEVTTPMKMNEALKLIGAKGLIIKKISSKIESIESYASGINIMNPVLGTPANHEKELKALRQGVADLENDYIGLKERIERTNLESKLTVNGVTKSITGWRAWQQMLYPSLKKTLEAHNTKNGERTRITLPAAEKGGTQPAVVAYYKPEEVDKEKLKLADLYEAVKARIETFNATTDLI